MFERKDVPLASQSRGLVAFRSRRAHPDRLPRRLARALGVRRRLGLAPRGLSVLPAWAMMVREREPFATGSRLRAS